MAGLFVERRFELTQNFVQLEVNMTVLRTWGRGFRSETILCGIGRVRVTFGIHVNVLGGKHLVRGTVNVILRKAGQPPEILQGLGQEVLAGRVIRIKDVARHMFLPHEIDANARVVHKSVELELEVHGPKHQLGSIGNEVGGTSQVRIGIGTVPLDKLRGCLRNIAQKIGAPNIRSLGSRMRVVHVKAQRMCVRHVHLCGPRGAGGLPGSPLGDLELVDGLRIGSSHVSIGPDSRLGAFLSNRRLPSSAL